MSYYAWVCLGAGAAVRFSSLIRRPSFAARTKEVRSYIASSTVKAIVFSWLVWAAVVLGLLQDNWDKAAVVHLVFAVAAITLSVLVILFVAFSRVHGDLAALNFVGEALSTRRPFTFSTSNGFVLVGLFSDLVLGGIKLKNSWLDALLG